MTLYIIIYIAGVVTGALITRRNLSKVNAAVEAAKELKE